VFTPVLSIKSTDPNSELCFRNFLPEAFSSKKDEEAWRMRNYGERLEWGGRK
jgi:hypothetical protein